MVQKRVNESSSGRKNRSFRGFSSDAQRKKATASLLPSPSRSIICRDCILLPPVGFIYS